MRRPSGANIADQLATRWWPTPAAYALADREAGRMSPRAEATLVLADMLDQADDEDTPELGPEMAVDALLRRPDLLRRLLRASP